MSLAGLLTLPWLAPSLQFHCDLFGNKVPYVIYHKLRQLADSNYQNYQACTAILRIPAVSAWIAMADIALSRRTLLWVGISWR